MKPLIAAFALTAATAFPALADEVDDMIRTPSTHTVAETADRLVAAAEAEGAKVFARVDHGAGAKTVGADIGDSQLVIFGNPKAGTPVMEKNRLAGVVLPLRVLVYQDQAGKVWLAHEDMAERLDDLDGIDENDPAVQPLAAALQKLTAEAAN